MKVHYGIGTITGKRNPKQRTICGRVLPESRATANWLAVTCKLCLRTRA